MAATHKIAVQTKATYVGHSIGKNEVVKLNLMLDYEHLPKAVEMLQFLNLNIFAECKVEKAKQSVGEFVLKQFKVDRDGETVIQLESDTGNCYLDTITKIVGKENISFMFTGTAELG